MIYRYERSLPPRYAWLAHWPPWLAVKWAFTALVLNYMAMSFLVRTAKRMRALKGPRTFSAFRRECSCQQQHGLQDTRIDCSLHVRAWPAFQLCGACVVL